jgi:hypothetical protein
LLSLEFRTNRLKNSAYKFLVWAFLLPCTAIAAEASYEFNGEGQTLLDFIQSPPHGQDYCSLRFYMNRQSIIYSFAYQPGLGGLQVGDRVVTINGTMIEGPPSIPDALRSLSSKDKLKVVVDRNKTPVEVTRACVNDAAIDNTIKSLAESIVSENWPECRKLVKKVEQHEKRAEWINIRMRCNYMHAKTKNNLAAYWNSNWPIDIYQFHREALKAAQYGSMEELDQLRPSVIQAISDLRRNGRRMFSGDLANEFDATIKMVQIRNGLLEPEEPE